MLAQRAPPDSNGPPTVASLPERPARAALSFPSAASATCRLEKPVVFASLEPNPLKNQLPQDAHHCIPTYSPPQSSRGASTPRRLVCPIPRSCMRSSRTLFYTQGFARTAISIPSPLQTSSLAPQQAPRFSHASRKLSTARSAPLATGQNTAWSSAAPGRRGTPRFTTRC